MFVTKFFKRASSSLLCLILVIMPLFSLAVPSLAVAQTTGTTGSTDSSGSSDAASAVAARQAQLQSELSALQTQINAQQAVITQNEGQQQTLQSAISTLNAQIKSAQLSIQARNLTIEGLQQNIAADQTTVGTLSNQLQAEQNSLADLIRQANDMDQRSLVEFALSDETLDDFFSDLDDYDSIRASLNDSFTAVSTTKANTQADEDDLTAQETEQSQLLSVQQLQEQRVQAEQTQEAQLLAETKGQESKYQALLASTQQSAASIRAELFTLTGSTAISFATALSLADKVSAETGVRPAFLLGIIAEESDLGANVGTGNWKVDMKAPRDTVPFLAICQSLGLDPDLMPVSKKPWYGYGGAMGPAQFIPSTWVLYETKITALTGDNPPNPWDPYDAFTAAAILLEENGASNGKTSSGTAAERLAALRYLAGWTNASDPSYAFYGDDVMNLAANYQSQIDILNQ